MLVNDRRQFAATLAAIAIRTLIVLCLLWPAAPAGAQTAAADPFTVSGVEVDVTAGNATEAQSQAILQAQRKAFGILYSRLQQGSGTPPAIDDVALQRLVIGFEIEREQTSAVRYVASMLVTFQPDAVRAFFDQRGTAMAEPPARPYLVVPVYRGPERAILWEERTPWRSVWEDRAGAGGAVPILVPLGELADIADLSVDEALAGDGAALDRIQARYDSEGVFVVVFEHPAAPGAPATVKVIRYRGGRPVDEATVTPPPNGTEPGYSQAVAQVMTLIEAAWKSGAMVQESESEMAVMAPIASLQEWAEIRRRLAQMDRVGQIKVVSLSRRRVEIFLRYRGETEQLRERLAAVGLELIRGGTGPQGGWELRLAGTPAGAGPVGAAPIGGNPFGAPPIRSQPITGGGQLQPQPMGTPPSGPWLQGGSAVQVQPLEPLPPGVPVWNR